MRRIAELARLVERGAIKPRLFKTMDLSQAREAQELSETGKTQGKVILKVAKETTGCLVGLGRLPQRKIWRVKWRV